MNIRLKPDTRAAMRARDVAKQQGRKYFKHLRNKALTIPGEKRPHTVQPRKAQERW